MSDRPSQGTSPLALVSLVAGTVGLVMSFLGCMFSPVLFVSTVLCLVAVGMGAVELQNVRSGHSAEANRPYAVAGLATGAGGCLVSLAYVLFVVVLLALYAVFVLMMVGLAVVTPSTAP